MVQFFELIGKRGNTILDFFLGNPASEFSAADLKRKIEVAKKTLFGSLGVLENHGIIAHRTVGRAKMYSLNRENPAVKELKKLSAILSLQKMLKGAEGCEAFLFGSAARGEDTEKSDWDLLVIGSETQRASKNLNLPEKVSVVFFTPMEYALLRRNDPAFYERIEKAKVRIL
ncbi:nucleotidyltransferase domain-containing protein [Candidatus Micrarchaeota archaeon]|nr:nucleotidyltransferase domain-containing protein [Candidatus Micrarchaeota archaeon]